MKQSTNAVLLSAILATSSACSTALESEMGTENEPVDQVSSPLNKYVTANPLPQAFATLSARAKQTELMSRVVRTRYANPPVDAPLQDVDTGRILGWLNPLGGNAAAKRFLRVTLDADSDDMPQAHDKKIVHAVGSVASVELIAEPGSKYTGLYRGAFGLARFSLAVKPGKFTPGIGLKLFVDGAAGKPMPSANVLAMFSIDGQENNDFFANDLTNRIAAAQGGATKIIENLFTLASPTPGVLSVAPLARVNVNGSAVTSPVAPCQIVFTPTAAVRGLIAGNSRNDFRTDLARVRANTDIYEVWGKDACTDASPRVRIGTLRTTSDMISSEYGDRAIFFKHQEFR